jgi:hypothetical protein
MAILVMAACGDDDDTSSTLPEQSSTTLDEEAAVLDAYQAGWQAYQVASGDPVDPDHPALAETMTDGALDASRSSLGALAERGEYLGGPSVELSPEVTELEDSEATVEDCVVDHGITYGADGSEVERSDGEPLGLRAVMVKEDGTWKRSILEEIEACDQ